MAAAFAPDHIIWAAGGKPVQPGIRLERIEEDGLGCCVAVESGGEERSLDCETVLLALGFLPTADQAEPFKAIAPVGIIGDSRIPRKILFAIEAANEARGLA